MHFIYDNINHYSNLDYTNIFSQLNEIDQNKIKSFIYKKDKKRCMLARILLNKLLKEKYFLDCNFHDFKYNHHGKPFLKSNSIFFSISHSHEYSIVATSTNKIGVDIEYIKNVNMNIINYFCTNREKNYILTSPNPYQALFEIFCLKEAYFKMLGTGITNMKEIEFIIKENQIFCNRPNLNIKLNHEIKDYMIAIVEEKNETIT